MLKTKEEKLVTAGEFARLAQSTKRTIHWYEKQGLLKAKTINEKGYRFYSIEQIIDLQVIMLLRRLNFSLPEVKTFLQQNASAKELFLLKKKTLLQEVKELQKKITSISTLYTNLEKDGILFTPTIKTLPSFETFSIEKVGPYSKILEHCHELKSYFARLPKQTTYFVLFPDREYAPKKDRLRIGIVAKKGMKVKKEFENVVKKEIIPGFKTVCYKHNGSPALISMIIMQMHEYMDKKGIKQDLTIPINELEFYINSSLNDKNLDFNEWVSEINIPML